MVLVVVKAQQGSLQYRSIIAWTYLKISVVWGFTLAFLGIYSVLSAIPRAIYRFFRPPIALDLNSLNIPSVPNSRMN